jgi:galactokinase
MCQVELSDLSQRPEEENTTAALIRGVAARFVELGCAVSGFDAYVMSTVLPGSGLSSSAAFEVLIGTILNKLFYDGALLPMDIAKIGQFAENAYFGKPCGLMDQMASAVGGLVAMDFGTGMVRPLQCDLSQWDHALCIIDTHASHAQLTGEYAAVPGDMKAVAAYFDCDVLSEVPQERFYREITALRQACGDRAVLRCIHYYEENRRVQNQWAALEEGNFRAFLEMVKESGRSSFQYLQNVVVSGSTEHQDMAMALALCEKYLKSHGACRVHGGGFAGTIQAFVPRDELDGFCRWMDALLGPGSCRVLSIRPEGGIELEVGQ